MIYPCTNVNVTLTQAMHGEEWYKIWVVVWCVSAYRWSVQLNYPNIPYYQRWAEDKVRQIKRRQGQGHTSWTRSHIMDKVTHHGQDHTSWTRSHIMDKITPHGQGHTSWTRSQINVYVNMQFYLSFNKYSSYIVHNCITK